MSGFHHFSPKSYRDHGEPPPGREQERSLSPWVQTPPGTDSEDEAPWLHPGRSPTLRHRRPGDSHSLTHVARRTPVHARKHRSGSRYLEDAWMDSRTRTKFVPAWQQQPPLRPQRQGVRPSQGESPPLYPGRAHSALSVGSLLLDEAHTGDRWAVPVCRHAGLGSPASVLTDKSSVRSQECRTQCVCSQKRDGGDVFESLAGRYSQPSAFRPEVQSQQAQVLRSKLEEAMMSSRDQKIVALVLTRLKKARRMRELQQQAAVAWEELKRSDQKVQLTLERERRRLLQQNREQWQPRPEPRKARPDREQPGRRRRRWRDGQAKSALQPDSGRRAALDHQEHPGLDNLELRARSQQADPLQQCQEQHLRERERVLQSLRELNRQQQQERMEKACPKKQVHATEDTKTVQEGNLSSLVNFQARKVLMDCQAKAEELLRKLSLEQRFQGCQESYQSPRKDPYHRELQEKARKEAEQIQQDELEKQRRVRKRIMLELAEQKVRQAKSHALEAAWDPAKHPRALRNLRDQSRHDLKLKAEREEKSHVEGIKEAIKKERATEQLSRGKEPTLHEFQKVPRASKRDSGAFANSCLDPVASESQLHHHQTRGVY